MKDETEPAAGLGSALPCPAAALPVPARRGTAVLRYTGRERCNVVCSFEMTSFS